MLQSFTYPLFLRTGVRSRQAWRTGECKSPKNSYLGTSLPLLSLKRTLKLQRYGREKREKNRETGRGWGGSETGERAGRGSGCVSSELNWTS